MSRGTGALDRLFLSSPQQRILRLGAGAAALAFLGVLELSGGSVRTPFLIGALLLVVTVVVLPEGPAGLGLVLFLGALWWTGSPGRLDAWTPLAAVLLGTVHLACTVASHGPPGLRLERAVWRRWGRRWGLASALAVLVWLLVGLLGLGGPGPSAWSLAAALLVLLAWAGLWNRELSGADEVPSGPRRGPE